jgi:NAD(P)-dependent dehydrogenase (short-subunit alcohol dehydrogenase family)
MGIGQGIALRFADEGADVVIADVAEAEGEKTAAEITAMGRQGVFIRCDVTSSQQVNDLVEATVSKFGKVDVLVNNAGGVPEVTPGGSIVDIDDAQWARFLALNLSSQFYFCRAVVPHMKQAGYGKIVNVSSIGVVQPSDSVIHYHSAKAGVLGLTQNLAYDLAPHGICVNSVMPGPIRTPFWENVTRNMPPGAKEALFDKIARDAVPMGRIGVPDDIAGVALFLASGLSGYVTGVNICAAGGIPLLPHQAPEQH